MKAVKRLFGFASSYLPVILFIALLFTAAYYGSLVLKMRSLTPGIVKYAEENGLMMICLNDLSEERKRILLMVEDPNFYKHKGIDLKTPGAGMTTITQALVKRLYYKNFKPGFRKMGQTLLARFAMHPLVSKDKQLELFLNLAYMGSWKGIPLYGFHTASLSCFGKPFREITDEEYLVLVAMLVAPNLYHPKKNPEASRERVERIRKLISGEYSPDGLMDVYYGQALSD